MDFQTSYNPEILLLSVHPRQTCTIGVTGDIGIFIALFTESKNPETTQVPTEEWWVNKMWYITME